MMSSHAPSFPGIWPLAAAAAWTTPQRIFVVDDDEVFGRVLQRFAALRGVSLQWFHPDEFDRLPMDGDFDVAVIDYDLGEVKGHQLSALYRETPVLLVSAHSMQRLGSLFLPPSVGGFMPKGHGLGAILAEALRLGREASEGN